MSTCDKCGRSAIIYVRYSGARLCEQHFSDFVERRVKHEIREQVDIKGGERLAVALSGGKDSAVALQLLIKILGQRRDLDFCAITVDEGIQGYRDVSVPLVTSMCRRLGIEHLTVSFRELYGTTMDDVSRVVRRQSACTYCGVLRRKAMNSAARNWEASHLATGLNLDDTAQSIMMNFARGDVERLARMGPHKRAQPGLIPRIQPLRTIPENETLLYAMVNGLEFHHAECPYAPEALRNAYRATLASLEDQFPGTRHSVLRSYEQLRPSLERSFGPAVLRTCECGEPTISDKCKACVLLESLGLHLK